MKNYVISIKPYIVKRNINIVEPKKIKMRTIIICFPFTKKKIRKIKEKDK